MSLSALPYRVGMQDAPQLPELKVPKWPFVLANAFMLGLAWYLFYWQARLPLGEWAVLTCCLCVFLGAVLGVLPYLLEYRALLKYGALVKLIESSSLTAATEKIQNLENCVRQISQATAQLESAQAKADETTQLAGQITGRMTAEVRGFKEFMQNANDSERATLRLEVEKLHRAEREWLNVLVFILDHTFALHRAAERSGQENVIRQLAQFQHTCRDAARRIGLQMVGAQAGEAFDPQRHALEPGQEVPAGGSVVETLACGYTYQSTLIRPTLVRLQAGAARELAGSSAGPQLSLNPARSDPS
ncbi:MAG TPA: nucleotide exchange factor GrpE [Verrucomicrobiota bacterium]|nr:nucleotide exchange factor GrpE [Verrucomicrobiota bacterium]HNT16108.1 nucleotide exchange factor GrpE [Verrucomicrobiota bacterium]